MFMTQDLDGRVENVDRPYYSDFDWIISKTCSNEPLPQIQSLCSNTPEAPRSPFQFQLDTVSNFT